MPGPPFLRGETVTLNAVDRVDRGRTVRPTARYRDV
jgi:hypothetical protein